METQKEKKTTTSQLLRDLFKATSPERYFQTHKNDPEPMPLHLYLQEQCRKLGKKPAHIIKLANLEPSYGYQVFKGTRKPSRDTVLQLAFGFEANLNQAQLLLRYANMSPLYPRVKRDAAIIYCLQHKKSLWDAENLLVELELPMIGERRHG